MILDYQQPQPVYFEMARIPENDVLRRLGYPQNAIEHIEPGIRTILDEVMRQARELFEPRGICRFLRVASRSRNEFAFHESGFRIHSEQVVQMLDESETVVFFMVTLGPGLDGEVERLMHDGETTRAFVMDAIGSETADALADELHHHLLRKAAEERGYTLTPRFSPGYGDWPVTVQSEMMKLCEGGQIGISLTPSCMMIPKKSVSAVLGWRRKE